MCDAIHDHLQCCHRCLLREAVTGSNHYHCLRRCWVKAVQRDTIIYNAFISACWQQALSLFEGMLAAGAQRDTIIMRSINELDSYIAS